jgi:integrase
MQEKIKYLEKRDRKGGPIWVCNPSDYAREHVGATYEQFQSRAEAVDHCKMIARAVEEFERTREKQLKLDRETVDALFHFYTQHKAFKHKAENTKRTYRFLYKTVAHLRIGGSNAPFGQVLARSVDAAMADKVYDAVRETYSVHRANGVCKILRRIWFTGRRGFLAPNAVNPFAQMGLTETPPRVVLWEPEQVSEFISQADKQGLNSIGTLALLCYDLCQRPGDMRKVTWSQYVGGVFTFIQEKTKAEIQIEVSPRLKQRLSGLTRGSDDDPIVMCETTGKAYDNRLYSKYAFRIRQAAGLPEQLQLRDLRRTGATELAEAGCTEDELRSVTGHMSRNVLNVYVRPTKKLAESAMSKRFG